MWSVVDVIGSMASVRRGWDARRAQRRWFRTLALTSCLLTSCTPSGQPGPASGKPSSGAKRIAASGFEVTFEIAVAERRARYLEARDRILTFHPAEAVAQATTPRGDWRTRLVAEILVGWLERKPLYLRCDQYVRGDLALPRPLPGFTVRHRVSAIVGLGPAVLPRILERLWKTHEHDDADERATLFGVLRELADQRTIMPMVELVEDPSSSPDVQASAVSVLGALNGGLDSVLRLAHDPNANPTARGIAIRNLGRFSHARATHALLDILRDVALPLEDRRSAAEGLRVRADPATRPEVLDALWKEHDKLLRVALIHTFGRIGTDSDIQVLQDLAAKNKELKERVDGAIKDIRRRGQRGP